MAQSAPTQPSGSRYCIIAFLNKVPSLTLDEFRDYYENKHIPLVRQHLKAAGAPLPLVYVRRYLDPKNPVVPSGQGVGFDCVTELQFASKEDFEKYWVAPLMVGEGGKIMGEDEARFMVREKTLAYVFEMQQTQAEGQYHWVSEFAPPSFQKGLSYCVGWLTAIAWQVYLAGACFIVGSLVQGLIALNNPNYVYHRWHGTLLTVAVVALSAVYNVVLAKRLPILGQLLLVCQVVGLFATVIPLWVKGPKGQASQVLFQVEDNGGWGNKGLSAMIGLAPIVGVLNGYDCIAHMSEEINDASRVLPIAMIFSVSLNIVLFLIMGITLIFCLGDLDSVINTNTGQPFIQIYYNATQSHSGTSVMVGVSVILIVFCGVNEVATSSRQIW
ncbi:uncharacterized protein N0V89_006208 [Didymosphaeria variabile]|uniref:EthD domain-containing protein n=1 Tax=Didymosphaeria variabile TaxID=1932322 RepID=A0A9W9CB70_9PLEO|nr:uncharacterized protein N0V89_006208 [Didymosphaeria variabile]KAJ4354471.1 hypothetical protein N0V89_006208 [Didymosphaeria variabile]